MLVEPLVLLLLEVVLLQAVEVWVAGEGVAVAVAEH